MNDKKKNDGIYDNLYMAIRDAIYEAVTRVAFNLDIKIRKNGWAYEIEISNKKSPK